MAALFAGLHDHPLPLLAFAFPLPAIELHDGAFAQKGYDPRDPQFGSLLQNPLEEFPLGNRLHQRQLEAGPRHEALPHDFPFHAALAYAQETDFADAPGPVKNARPVADPQPQNLRGMPALPLVEDDAPPGPLAGRCKKAVHGAVQGCLVRLS